MSWEDGSKFRIADWRQHGGQPSAREKPTPPKGKRASSKWCRRKVGREHSYEFLKAYEWGGWRNALTGRVTFPKRRTKVFRCSACGHKVYKSFLV